MTFHKLEARLAAIGLYGATALVLAFFYAPILTLMGFSLREGRHLILPFDGWTLDWYAVLLDHPDFADAVSNTATIAAVSTVFCTILGTGGALAWARYSFRLKRYVQAMGVAPLFFPQLLLGLMLLLWFSLLGNWLDFSTGVATVIVGHIVYITPFALLIVSVQVRTFDEALVDAARDLGARTWQVYREVILPILWPSITAAAIFSFLLSWGNFYITYSLAGTDRTLPTFVFSGIAMGSTPIYPALATLIFIPGLLLVALAEHLRRRALRRAAGGTPAAP